MSEPYKVLPTPVGLDLMVGIVLTWLVNKATYSQLPALFVPKAPLPVLGTPSNGQATRALMTAVNNRLGQLEYHSDPFGGTGDLYNHPEHTEWLLQHQGPNENRPRDCDDFAVYAYALFRKAGVNPANIWIWNLIVGDQFRDVAWNHVIMGLTCADAPGRVYVLDTNSAAWHQPHEFFGTKDSVEAAVRKFFGDVYKDQKTGQPRQYKYLIDVPPPFVL